VGSPAAQLETIGVLLGITAGFERGIATEQGSRDWWHGLKPSDNILDAMLISSMLSSWLVGWLAASWHERPRHMIL
jgi:hypothetical protein